MLTVLTVGCAAPAQDRAELAVRWGVVDNYVAEGSRFTSRLTLENTGSEALEAEGWELYFNFQRLIDPESLPPEVELTHVNGSFYRLRPTPPFEPIGPGETRTWELEAQASAIKLSDAPAGFYVVYDEAHDRPLPITDVTVEPFEEERQLHRGPEDQVPVPTAELRFRENGVLRELPPEDVPLILPTPQSFEDRAGEWQLGAGVAIRYEAGLHAEAHSLAEALEASLGLSPVLEEGTEQEGAAIRLRTGSVEADVPEGAREEAYRLSIDPETGTEIAGAGPAGVFYGIQSLHSLIGPSPEAPVVLPAVEVTDAPRFGYRGLHLDVARHFRDRPAVEKLLDAMSRYKLNRFHFHLTDDEGWRLAIEGLPELTAVGGRRGHTVDERDHLIPSLGSGPDPDPAASAGSGFYTREDYVALVRRARARHIEVIPEIDVPGHARAAIVAMEARHERLMEEGREEEAERFRLHDPEDHSEYMSIQRWTDNVINVCRPSTYRFMEHVIDDLVAMHEEAGAPLRTVHIGGDEVPGGVWTDSAACTQLMDEQPDLEGPADLRLHFIDRVRRMLAERGLAAAGWEEVALAEEDGEHAPNPAFLDRDLIPYVWNNVWGSGVEDRGYRLANAGYEVVFAHASNLYFDLAHDKDPHEPGLYWAGFVGLRDAFFFAPFDIYLTADRDALGRPFEVEVFADHVRLSEEGRQNVLGLQGQLWAETLVSDERMEYMAFPRVLALAQRAWAPQPDWARMEEAGAREQHMLADWNAFVNQLGQRELPRLDAFDGGLAYRLPPPGAVIEAGLLRANSALPGLTIRYTTDGAEPTPASTRYTEPVEIDGPVQLRTFDTTGRGSRTVTVEP